MFIHHPRNLAHVAIPKTGSTSLHYALQRALGIDWKFDSGSPDLYHLFASDARQLLGRKRWPQLYSVAVVRNPYDRAVSLFHDFRNRGAIRARSFDAFVREDLAELAAKDVHFLPQRRFVEGDGKVLVKRLYAFEDGVQAIFEDICTRLDLAAHEASHARKSVRRGWQEYYARRDTLARVGEIYATDFDLLGYQVMTEPPMKPTEVHSAG
ncbi:MAG: hypothetical protein ACJAVR_002365 [Paracoccaceae bacterium]|jgi:hypothetical protein